MQVFDFLTNSTVVFFIANTLYVISYMLTSMVWLRVLAIIAAASTMPYFYLQLEPLWSAIFWQSCFLVVNLVNLLLLLFSMRAASFDDDQKLAYEIRFSDLKPHEVRPIFRLAEVLSVTRGHTLLKDGQENESLFLILDGTCSVIKDEVEIAVLGPGQFVGELSFLEGEGVSADVVADGDLKLMFWDRRGLEPLFKRQGLYETYFHALCSMDVAAKLRAMTTARVAW